MVCDDFVVVGKVFLIVRGECYMCWLVIRVLVERLIIWVFMLIVSFDRGLLDFLIGRIVDGVYCLLWVLVLFCGVVRDCYRNEYS